MVHLLQLPLELREQIINKLHWKSYFRLQQTCKYMEEFIRTNKHIKVYLPGSQLDVFSGNEDALPSCVAIFKGRCLDFDNFYGLSFERTSISLGIKGFKAIEDFHRDFHHVFEKYHIFSSDLDISIMDQLPTGVLGNLLAALKPKKAIINAKKCSRKLNRWEELLQAKQLRDVHFIVKPENLPDPRIMNTLMENCHKLKFTVKTVERSPFFAIFTNILQHLCFKPLPNLRSFTFDGWQPSQQMPSIEDLIKIFRDFNPIPMKVEEILLEPIHMFECRAGLDDRLCTLIFGPSRTDIYCKYLGSQ